MFVNDSQCLTMFNKSTMFVFIVTSLHYDGEEGQGDARECFHKENMKPCFHPRDWSVDNVGKHRLQEFG